MSIDTALWLGITAGIVIGCIGTWITLAIGTAIGRHLQRRAAALRAVIAEPPADTFDHNLRDLIAQQKRQQP